MYIDSQKIKKDIKEYNEWMYLIVGSLLQSTQIVTYKTSFLQENLEPVGW